MLERAADFADLINQSLVDLRASVDEVDPNGQLAELRVFLTYALRLAVNPELFKRDPTDMELVCNKVTQLAAFPKHIKYRATGSANRSSQSEWLAFTAKLYGIAWAAFDRDRFLANADLFKRRFVANGISLDFLKDAACLDFGCGSGRNCLALARLGAKSVLGVDLSEVNISNARKNVGHYPEASRIELQNANVFEFFAGKQNLFDFAVAQGVFQTMPSVDEAAQLVYRVLKPGGRFFVYFFGESEKGIMWDVAKTYRHLLKPVPLELTNTMLQMLDARQGDIFNLLDFAYVPHQHHWPQAKFEKCLSDAGFRVLTPMLRGENYDGHQRFLDYPWEKSFWGNFDLRYLAEK